MSRMNVSLPESCLEALYAQVPNRQRSRFVAEAVQEKLDRLRQRQAVRTAAGSWSNKGRGDVGSQVRDLRRGWRESGRSSTDPAAG